MLLRGLWGVAFLGGSLVSSTADLPPGQRPTFTTDVTLITVDAVVLDKKGEPVSGLTKDDFTITEDGRPQEIVSFEVLSRSSSPAPSAAPAAAASPAADPSSAPRASPRAFAILIDDLGISAHFMGDVRTAISSFLARSVADGDQVLVGNSSGTVWWTARLPEGRDDLTAVVQRARGRHVASVSVPAPMLEVREGLGRDRGIDPYAGPLGEYYAFLILRGQMPGNKGAAEEVDARRRDRMRRTFAALTRQLDTLALLPGRKSVLLMTEGFIQDLGSELRDMAGRAADANTAVYFIDVRGLRPISVYSAANEGMPDPSRLSLTSMEETNLVTAGSQDLASDTGGFSVRNTNDLAAGAARIARESSGPCYLLGIRPPDGTADGKWRKLRVEVKRPGLEVRARRGYRLRSKEPAPAEPADENGARDLAPAVSRALDSPVEARELPLRAMAYVQEPRGTKASRLLVAVEIDTRGLAPRPSGPRRLDLSVVAIHRDTGREVREGATLRLKEEPVEARGWRATLRELELPPGVSQIRVVAHDPASQELGSVIQRIDVPRPDSFHLSTPIVSDQMVPGSRTRPALGNQRVFGSTGAVYCQFEVFGATRPDRQRGPRVSAGIDVRAAGGRVIHAAAPTEIVPDGDQRVVRLVAIPLEGVPEGEYELRLAVRDEASGEQLEHVEAFRVTEVSRPRRPDLAPMP